MRRVSLLVASVLVDPSAAYDPKCRRVLTRWKPAVLSELAQSRLLDEGADDDVATQHFQHLSGFAERAHSKLLELLRDGTPGDGVSVKPFAYLKQLEIGVLEVCDENGESRAPPADIHSLTTAEPGDSPGVAEGQSWTPPSPWQGGPKSDILQQWLEAIKDEYEDLALDDSFHSLI